MKPIVPFAVVALFSACLSVGCHRDATVSVDDADRGTTAGPATRQSADAGSGWQTFGEPILADLPMADVAEVLATPAAFAGRDVQLRGTIAEVCAKKGCWLRIADPSGGAETVFVKFTCPVEGEYLIPTDAAGRPVVVQGQVVVEEMSQDQARHYAEDAGKSPAEVAAITGPQKTIRVMSPSARVATND